MQRKLEGALLRFIEAHHSKLSDAYDWKFSLLGFPSANFEITGNSPYEQSKSLRRFIHSAIAQDDKLKVKYQKWYVRDWGGVRGNKESTLDGYIKSSASELKLLGVKGVATWSKILSIRDPEKYAIYDARVALSINSLQLLENIKEATIFPQLPSRNNSFVVPAQKAIVKSSFFSRTKFPDFYQVYLDMLRNVAQRGPWDIQDIEMALFSYSRDLSLVWLKH
jgi:hypothetical protein